MEDLLNLTSEEISEVPTEATTPNQDDEEDFQDGEEPVSIPDDSTIKLLDDIKTFAERFRSINKQIATYRSAVLALKAKFEVRQGYSGKVFLIDKVKMNWELYCQHSFGVGARRINQLMNDTDKPLDNPKPKKIAKKSVESIKLTPAPTTTTTTTFKVNDTVVQPTAPAVKDVGRCLQYANGAPVSSFALGDPYAHFYQFKSEPQTLAGELAAMLVEFDVDDTTLLDLLKKELKLQRKELAQTKAAGK